MADSAHNIPPRKKLIEVALPLEAINRESAREKSIRHGHPSTLHLWWARRPLAACRAVLFSSLVDDPSSDPRYRRPDGTVDEEAASAKRSELFNLIEELVKWENSSNPKVIDAARAEIARCVASRKIETGELAKETVVWESGTAKPGGLKGTKHPKGPLPRESDVLTAYEVSLGGGIARIAKPEAINAFLAEFAPPVLDPFCGGGSIPLEAQRLGLRAFGSDLNPVPVLITKALIEIPPKFANMPPVNPESRGIAGKGSPDVGGKGKKKAGREVQGQLGTQSWKGAAGLAEDVRYYGRWMRDEAQKRIGHLYPKITVTEAMARDRKDLKDYIGQELTVIAWLWARTVPSPDPAAAGAPTPLLSTCHLSTVENKEAWLNLDREGTRLRYSVVLGNPPPSLVEAVDSGARAGRGKFKCLLTQSPIPPEYIKECGRTGTMGSALVAAVLEGKRGRVYLGGDVLPVPDEPDSSLFMDVPCPEISGYFNPFIYGFDTVGKLFSPRQKRSLAAFIEALHAAHDKVMADGGSTDYAAAMSVYLTLTLGRFANYNNSFCTWHNGRQCVSHTFAEQGVGMAWDFVETNPLSDSTGSWASMLNYAPATIASLPMGTGDARQHDAGRPFEHVASPVISMDPPYFSSITYADFADFFYCVHRACLSTYIPALYRTMATPKADEIVAAWHRFDGSRPKAGAFFTERLAAALTNVRQSASPDAPISVYYAFKQSESDEEGEVGITAWESILEVLLGSGFEIVRTWPVRTEYTTTRKATKNVLASSIVIVGRGRLTDAPMASRREFVAALKRELPAALRDLQSGNIAPVDLAQAAIGPGMAVFSRFAKVLETSGDRMGVRTALALINQVLDEVLAEQEGEYDADTRWCIKWFEQFAHNDGPYGDAETLCKAMAVGVNGLQETGVVAAKSGKVRLFKRTELMGGKPETWDPATDDDILHWEVCQYLCWALETGGEQAAADLLRRINAVYAGAAEVARDLAYRLYVLCERKKWASEAIAYNALVVSWPEIQKLVSKSPTQAAPSGLFS